MDKSTEKVGKIMRSTGVAILAKRLSGLVGISKNFDPKKHEKLLSDLAASQMAYECLPHESYWQAKIQPPFEQLQQLTRAPLKGLLDNLHASVIDQLKKEYGVVCA